MAIKFSGESTAPAPVAADERQAAPAPAPAMARDGGSGKREKRRGRPKSLNPKKRVSIRLDAALVGRYKASGRGWQTRLNADLLRLSGLA